MGRVSIAVCTMSAAVMPLARTRDVESDRDRWLRQEPESVAGCVETSMWQRQTHERALSPTSWCIAAGWGSWTMQTSHPPESSRAFISLYCDQVAHCSSVRSCGLPCSALCMSFVALKNSSRP